MPVYPGVAALAAACVALSSVGAFAQTCVGRPDALGTARVMTVDPKAHPRIGSFSFPNSLPLADKEVIVTFDDGPLPAYTASILATLESECVRATFFIVGQMARANPDWVRRIYNAGHTVGSHTLAHKPLFNFLSEETAIGEIEGGIAAVEEALGDKHALAPFFRFPGLRTSPPMERYLEGRGVMIWSVDFHGDDWRAISADEVVERAMRKLARKGRGVLLLHDIQARTAMALPKLLRRLKAEGYRVVHAVPAGEGRPQKLPELAPAIARRSAPSIWPAPLALKSQAPPELPVPSALSFGFPELFGEEIEIPSRDSAGRSTRISTAALSAAVSQGPRFASRPWPRPIRVTFGPEVSPGLAVPSAQSLSLSRPLAWQVQPLIARRAARPVLAAPVRRQPRSPQAAEPAPPTEAALRPKEQAAQGKRPDLFNWFR